MAAASKTDPEKVHYLGRGVDCRTPRDTWITTLDNDCCENLVQDNKNVEETAIALNHFECIDRTNQCTMSAGCCAKIKPNECMSLAGELTICHFNSKTKGYTKRCTTTKKISMKENTSKDPDVDDKEGGIGCTDIQRHVIKFILNHIDEKQKEIDLGKPIAQLKGCNPEDKFEEYMSEATKADRASQLQIWQMVADACSLFIDIKKCTHYVRSIVLGAVLHESTESHECSTSITCKVGVKAMESVDCSSKIKCQGRKEEKITFGDGRGKMDKSTGAVTTEEVISVTLTPLFHLINKKELRLLMEAALHCYDHSNQGTPSGPFTISCREGFHESEQEIYWQVNNTEIHGTTVVEEASNFYIKRVCNLFRIIHMTEHKRTEHKRTQYYILPDGHRPLKLVPSVDNHQKIGFVLKSNVNESVDIPQTMASWKNESPFYIKRPKVSSSRQRKGKCYLSFSKQDEHQKQNHDQDSTLKHDIPSRYRYTAVASDKLDTTNSLMLFYFTPVTECHCGLPGPVQLRIQSDCSELAGQSTDSTSELPSSIQQAESGSSTVKEFERELVELVGREYIFPLQIQAE